MLPASPMPPSAWRNIGCERIDLERSLGNLSGDHMYMHRLSNMLQRPKTYISFCELPETANSYLFLCLSRYLYLVTSLFHMLGIGFSLYLSFPFLKVPPSSMPGLASMFPSSAPSPFYFSFSFSFSFRIGLMKVRTTFISIRKYAPGRAH